MRLKRRRKRRRKKREDDKLKNFVRRTVGVMLGLCRSVDRLVDFGVREA